MTAKLLSAATLALGLGLAAPASADPLVGFGVSFAFGGGSSDVGLGLRVFSDDEEDTTVASVGMDYMFTSQSWRATAGVAHLMDGSYIGADVGLKLNGGGFDFGLSLGAADTEDEIDRSQINVPPSPPPNGNQDG
ncbi:hypothetical protein [Pseudooceanicola sp. 200-1SW]|uniref:hypothetical protein n=1 Tax=Pseudooceanicola sp. 200-1SW TaxID=3425949 RepID=UPI003D7FD634